MKNKNLLTIGELAKEMDVSVRTLQYYDKEGLLHPSAKSERGRRIYTKKDMVKLHQILSLKHLGFSLDEIKNKLFSLEDPMEVAQILKIQGGIIKEQIENLKSALSVVEALHEEVMQIKSVDFSKYADIIALLKQQNENYWVVKLFNDKLSTHTRERFKDNPEDGLNVLKTYSRLLDETILLKEKGALPDSKQSIAIAKDWWDMINDFTGGDMSLLPELMEFNKNKEDWNDEMARKQQLIDEFLGQALEAYFKTQNMFIPELEDD